MSRPWCEVKSRRGAPKRVNTEGFACPNRKCLYFGITEPQIHALVGDGKHGCAEQIQTFRGPACRTTFSARRNTPLYRLKTPSHKVAVVLASLAEGLDPSAAERVFGYRQATITRWLTRAGKHAELFHEHSFRNLHIPHLQLDELRTRLRCSTRVRLSVAGHRSSHQDSPRAASGSPYTTDGAPAHPLPATALSPWLSSPFYQRWVKLVLPCFDRSFWTLAHRKLSREERVSVAGRAWPDLRPGEEKLTFGASWCGSRT